MSPAFRPAASAGPRGPDVGHDDAVVPGEAESRRHGPRNGLKAHADFLPPQPAELPQLTEDRARRRARNRKAETLVTAGLRDDEGVDAHDFSADVDEWTSRVAWIDRRICLDAISGESGSTCLATAETSPCVRLLRSPSGFRRRRRFRLGGAGSGRPEATQEASCRRFSGVPDPARVEIPTMRAGNRVPEAGQRRGQRAVYVVRR